MPTYLYAWLVGPWDIVNGPTIPANQWRYEPVILNGTAVKFVLSVSLSFSLQNAGRS